MTFRVTHAQSMVSLCYILCWSVAETRRGQAASGADDGAAEGDQTGMMSQTKDPAAGVSGRKGAKGARGDGRDAQGEGADMMSKMGSDPEAEMLGKGLSSLFIALLCLLYCL